MREENEDRYLARQRSGWALFAVADGVAGELGGAVASAAAVDGLEAALDTRARDAAAMLSSAVRAANDAVVRASADRGLATAASTLVAAAAHGRTLAVANLGDSRAYLVRGGQARQITTDHSGPIPSSITRYLGDDRGVTPDVFVEPLRRRDRVVLCSDGLTRHVTGDEIAATGSAGSVDRAAHALVELATSRGGEDNVTVVVYESPVIDRQLFVGLLAVVFWAFALILLQVLVVGLTHR